MTSSSGYPDSSFAALSPEDAAELLARVLERAGGLGNDAIVAFDLDSTLLDNRPRQAQLLREYGVACGLALEQHTADHWQGWDARIAMTNAGLVEELVEAHIGPFRAFWRERFFTSEYCVLDRAIAGAAAFVGDVVARGARVYYVTGRHEEMRAGTVSCLEQTGFPVPDGSRVDLLMKPTLDEHDDAYKQRTYATLASRGTVIAAFDNEPAHINGYLAAFPDAVIVHLATDHSMRDIPLAPGIPSIRDFDRRRQG
jgi:hypothetical protein